MNQNVFPQIGTEKDIFPLQVVQRFAVLYSVVGLFIALYFCWPSYPVIGGFVAGSLIGIFNFRFLKNLIAKLMTDEGARSRWGFLFFIKIISLIATTGILILVVQVSALAFVIGFSSVIFGIFFEGVRGFF